MVFSSTIFLFGFLPLSLLVYYVSPLKIRNLTLFLLSLIFYGFGEPTYILVMLFSVTVAYLTGFPIGKYRESAPKKAKFWLILSICLNLGMLVFFKYTNFIIENLSLIPPLSGVLEPIEGLTLPMGISFFSFQIILSHVQFLTQCMNVCRLLLALGGREEVAIDASALAERYVNVNSCHIFYPWLRKLRIVLTISSVESVRVVSRFLYFPFLMGCSISR